MHALYREEGQGWWNGPWVGGRTQLVRDQAGYVILGEPTPRVNHAVPSTLRDKAGLRDVTFQWSHADTNDGNFTDIDGATESTYFPTAADNGKFLKLTASYKDRYVRDEYLEITPVKTLSVVSDDAISLYTRTFGRRSTSRTKMAVLSATRASRTCHSRSGPVPSPPDT